MAKLGKATQDTYNWDKWLILKALLKNLVAEGVAFEVNDSKWIRRATFRVDIF